MVATPTFSPPAGPAAATISGDGVSPAASAACNGSPPGKEWATASALAGRSTGSLSRQRRIARSTTGSSPSMKSEGVVGVDSICICASSAGDSARKGRRPVNSS